MKKQKSAPDLQEEIDDLLQFDSDRPSVEVYVNEPRRSVRPKLPDTILAKVIAVVIALGAIAEVVHEIVK